MTTEELREGYVSRWIDANNRILAIMRQPDYTNTDSPELRELVSARTSAFASVFKIKQLEQNAK